MDCSKARETMALSVAGEFDADLARDFNLHLDSCASCREEEVAMRRAAALFREGVVMPEARARRVMVQEVMSAVREAETHNTARARSRRLRRQPAGRLFWLLPLSAAAAVLLVTAAAYLRTPERKPRRPALAGAEKPSAEESAREEMPGAEEEPVRTAEAGPEEAPLPLPLPQPEEELAFRDAPEPEWRGGAQEAFVPARMTRPRSSAQEPRTPRVLASFAHVEGLVHYRRAGGKWRRAVERVKLIAGDELDTRSGLAAVRLEGGGSIYCNKGTWARVEAARVQLLRGEICCEFGPGEGVAVATADGVARHLGTRFSVKALPSGTTVTVEEGTVEVKNEGGGAKVEAGFQVSLRRGHAPGRPRRVDAARLLAWASDLRRTGAATVLWPPSAVPDADAPAGWTTYDAPDGRLAVSAVGNKPTLALTSGPQFGAVATGREVAEGRIRASFCQEGSGHAAVVFRYKDQALNLRWRIFPGGAQFSCRNASGSMTVADGQLVRPAPGREGQLSGPGLVRGRWCEVCVTFEEVAGKLHMQARWWHAGQPEPRGWMMVEEVDLTELPGPGHVGVHSGGGGRLLVGELVVEEAR